MLLNNQNKIKEKKIKNKVGGDANESRFGGLEREMRKHKLIIAPSVNTNGMVKFEQGWNRQAVRKDVVRITINGERCIVERTYLEQALATLAQGDEILKYQAPVIGR